MAPASRTTEGLPSDCPICGKKVWIAPSVPKGDATCPHCGNLLWFPHQSEEIGDDIHRLEELGASVEVDDEGQIRVIRFSGDCYDDSVIEKLSQISGAALIDIRTTKITASGAARLRQLLPDTIIEH